MDQRIQRVAKMSLEDETVTILAELEQSLTDLLVAHPHNAGLRARVTALLAFTDRVRQKFAPQWGYLKDPPPLPVPRRPPV